jgi:folate-binding protein YgfZ
MNPLTATPSTPLAGTVQGTAALRSGAYMVLDQYGLIGVAGADAASFLHNLLTNDIQALPEDRARLAGFCTPKGRLLASMLAWRDAQTIHLMLSAELAEPIRKRLSMFVLRAKAKLHDALATTRLIGLCIDAGAVEAGARIGPDTGAAAPLTALLAPHFDALPAQPYDVSHGGVHASGSLLRLPDAAGLARYLWAAPAAVWEARAADWAAALAQVEPHTWDWLAVHAGEPRITAATQEKFVPQMINFEVIGGVNFKKGCYPGQEIVARSQYLGTIKRRAMLAHLDAAAPVHTAAPGIEVYNSDDPAQPCGLVINAAAVPGAAGSLDCLIEIKLDALTHGSVHLGAVDGPLLSVSQPPYAFPDLDAA